MRLKICCLFVVSLLSIGGLARNADASFITSTITYTNVSGSPTPYGTVTISDVSVGRLRVNINVNDAFGANRDIHQFGFNMNSVFMLTNTALTVLPFNPPTGTYSISAPGGAANTRNVSGNGSNLFDYVVDFGAGTPYVEPMIFDLLGSGLDINDFNPASNTGINNSTGTVQFGIHLQSTAPLANSVFLGGNYGTVQGGPGGNPEVPEPTSVLIWLSASMCGVGLTAYRKRKKLVS